MAGTSDHVRYCCSVSTQQQQHQYEDVLLVAPASGFRDWSLFAVFDGHHGDKMAKFLKGAIIDELQARLPKQPAPGGATADSSRYAAVVRLAVTASFLALSARAEREARRLPDSQGPAAIGAHGGTGGSTARASCGATATIALQTGSLLTVANVGSSRCVLDTGSCAMEMTTNDRLGESEEEDERLAAAGATVARLRFDLSGPARPDQGGCGPLRVWPGGLSVSRSIGDADSSDAVIPYPHIKQVWLPRRACRLIIATDTVWGSFETFQKAAGLLRGVGIANAASALLARAAVKRRPGADGDRSAVIVDFVPARMNGYKQQVALDRLSRTSAAGSERGSIGGAPSLRLHRRSVASNGSGSGGSPSPSGADSTASGGSVPASPRGLRQLIASLLRCTVCGARQVAHEAAIGVGGADDTSALRFAACVDTFHAHGNSSYEPVDNVIPVLDAELQALRDTLQQLTVRLSLPEQSPGFSDMQRRSYGPGSGGGSARGPRVSVAPPLPRLRSSHSAGDLQHLDVGDEQQQQGPQVSRLPPLPLHAPRAEPVVVHALTL